MRVLIIEDEPLLREILVGEFELEGFAVSEAEDGESGYKKALEMHPDVVITDVRLPNGNGIEFMTKLHEMNHKVPVILVSGLMDISTSDAKKMGAKYVFSKPVDFETLIAATKAACKA